MFGKAYTFTRDCCGTLVSKQELTQIKLQLNVAAKPNTTMQGMMPQGNQPVYSFGHLFQNTYVNYCLCMACYATFGHEIELDNQIVSVARIPFCCPCLGPFPIQSKQRQQVGQLHPHCYCWKVFCPLWSDWICQPCMSLDVTDSNLKETYIIKRTCCTCFCCAHWPIRDVVGNERGEIKQTGWFCPNYEVTLPEDNDRAKLTILTTIPYLP